MFLPLVFAFSVPKLPSGSTLYLLFICQDFLLFLHFKCVLNFYDGLFKIPVR